MRGRYDAHCIVYISLSVNDDSAAFGAQCRLGVENDTCCISYGSVKVGKHRVVNLVKLNAVT